MTLKLKHPGDKDEQQIPLKPSDARTGMYEATIPNPEKGDWVMDLIASKDGKDGKSREGKDQQHSHIHITKDEIGTEW